MKKIIKENKSKLIILLAIILGVTFVLLKTMTTDQKNYGEELWSRLSLGDVSSVTCQKAIEEYQSRDLLSQTRIFNSFYSYTKKRCLGLDQRNFNGIDGNYEGHTDIIFDLITGDTLVSCTTDFPKKIYSHSVFCSDSQNAWASDNDIPPPYPIYSNTWATLNMLGNK